MSYFITAELLFKPHGYLQKEGHTSGVEKATLKGTKEKKNNDINKSVHLRSMYITGHCPLLPTDTRTLSLQVINIVLKRNTFFFKFLRVRNGLYSSKCNQPIL